VSLSGIGSPLFGTVGTFSYFSNNHPLQNVDDNTTPVDGDALVDPDHPGHREAITTISHVDDGKHKKFAQWLKEELQKMELGSAPDPRE
jgi:hypothetical protein